MRSSNSPAAAGVALLLMLLTATSADLPHMEVAVGTIKDTRPNAGEAGKMEMELKVSTEEAMTDVQGFRITLNKASDDAGSDLLTQESSSPEFTIGQAIKTVNKFKVQLKSPARQAVAIRELAGDIELFVPKNDPAATVLVNSLRKHFGAPIESDTLKYARLTVIARSSQQYADFARERQQQKLKSMPQNQHAKMPTAALQQFERLPADPNGISISSEGEIKNLAGFEFRDQTGKPIPTTITGTEYLSDGVRNTRTWSYHFNERLPETAKLAIFIVKPEALVKVPFTLTDIPLP